MPSTSSRQLGTSSMSPMTTPALQTDVVGSPRLLETLAVIFAAHEMANGADLSRSLGLDALHLPRDVVFVDPFRVADGFHHQRRAPLVPAHERLLDTRVNGRLFRGHETRAHVDPVRAEGEARGELRARADAAGCDEGHAQLFGRLGEEDEVADVVLAGVAGALEAVHGDAVRAESLGGERVLDRDALVHDDDPVGLEELDPLAGISRPAVSTTGTFSSTMTRA